ncbi:hypothetical protein [Kutzneria chonburiensis]|uniref:Uncharacterized protein n=1 Tax=Kutzneria chonburiensis TaxID=1483604 RepID=A0ABV6N2X6_9PSEU|nr:hypothetical protein [Kutzneria chonburiensis]
MIIDWTPYVEPTEGAAMQHSLLCSIPAWISSELSDSSYPEGTYDLYTILCKVADGAVGRVDLVQMVNLWTRPDHLSGPPPGLNTVTHVLACANALERGGFLRRTRDGNSDRWTVLEGGEKRTIPDSQRRAK